MKKGQLLSQPFMYVFYALVAVAILFFGVRMLIDFINLGDEVAVKDFLVKFDGKVQDVYSDNFGSVISVNSLNVPNGIQEICIINFANSPDLSDVSNSDFRDYLNLQEASTRENLIVFGENIEGTVQRRYVDNLDPINNPTCSLVDNGKVNLRLSNRGNYVDVARVA